MAYIMSGIYSFNACFFSRNKPNTLKMRRARTCTVFEQHCTKCSLGPCSTRFEVYDFPADSTPFHLPHMLSAQFRSLNWNVFLTPAKTRPRHEHETAAGGGRGKWSAGEQGVYIATTVFFAPVFCSNFNALFGK